MTGSHPYPKSVLYHLFWCAVDWLYPPVCGGCDQPGYRWCPTCQSGIQPLRNHTCQRCGCYVYSGKICQHCCTQIPAFEKLRSYAKFEGPLRNAIHSLKYYRNIGLAESLSIYLADYYKTLNWNVDLVVPVPLSPRRRLERGYNQANLLAYPMALSCRLPYSNRALQRVRETRTQVGLTAGERQQNVMGAFSAEKSLVSSKCVLVVDDVATTGSTQQACASALLDAGASTVYGLTLARAVFQNEAAGDSQTSDHLIF